MLKLLQMDSTTPLRNPTTKHTERSIVFGSKESKGIYFDDERFYLEGQPSIRAIELWYDTRIYAMNIFYSNGRTVCHGKIRGQVYNLVLDKDEYISAVEGYVQGNVDRLLFHTSKDRQHGPFGDANLYNSDPFHLKFPDGFELKYIFGRFGDFDIFNKIGFGFGPLPTNYIHFTRTIGANLSDGKLFKIDHSSREGNTIVEEITFFSEHGEGWIQGFEVHYDNGEVSTHGKTMKCSTDRTLLYFKRTEQILWIEGMHGEHIENIEVFTDKRGSLGCVGRKTSRTEGESLKKFMLPFPAGSRLISVHSKLSSKNELEQICFGYHIWQPVPSAFCKSQRLNHNSYSGVPFDDFDNTDGGRAKIEAVRVYYKEERVCELQTMIKSCWIPKNSMDALQCECFTLDDHEYLIEVTGSWCESLGVLSIQFHTSKGRPSRVIGNVSANGQRFSLKKSGWVIASFFGYRDVGVALRQLGAVYGRGIVSKLQFGKIEFDKKKEMIEHSLEMNMGTTELVNATDEKQEMSSELLYEEESFEQTSSWKENLKHIIVCNNMHAEELQIADGCHATEKREGISHFLKVLMSSNGLRVRNTRTIKVTANVLFSLNATAWETIVTTKTPYTANVTLRYAGSDESWTTTIRGVYTSVKPKTKIVYSD